MDYLWGYFRREFMFRDIATNAIRHAGKLCPASGNRRVCMMWMLGLLCLLAVLWQFTRISLAEEKAVRLESTREKASSLARAYARQVSRSLQQVDQAAQALQYDWEELHQPQLLERRLRRILYASAGLRAAGVAERILRLAAAARVAPCGAGPRAPGLDPRVA